MLAPLHSSAFTVQEPDELLRFAALLRMHEVRSYLEIGVRFGGTFAAVVLGVPTIERAVALDIDPLPEFRSTVERLKELRPGCRFSIIRGDSGELKVRDAVVSEGDFDAILIDGDHRYNWVRTDWILYGPHGRLVAFHDIAKQPGWRDKDGVPIEVPRLWSEIRDRFRHRMEIVGPGSFKGIGVIKRGEGKDGPRPLNGADL